MSDAPGPRASAVAAQLLDFYREPARFRPAWIHGEAALPDGHIVFKFALGRFAHGWQRDLPKHDREEIVLAARAFVRQVCLREQSNHYQVLCLEPDAPPESVRENYRLMMALIHPDRQEGGDAVEWPTGCAQRVNEAYAVLADTERRADYEAGAQRAAPIPDIGPQGDFAFAHAPPRRPRPILRSAAVVGTVLAGLFILQSWWVNDAPRHSALLGRSAPAHWMRDAISDGLPRFLVTRPAFAFDPLDALEAPRAPRRLVAWVPAADGGAFPASAPQAAPAPPAIVVATLPNAAGTSPVHAAAPIVPFPARAEGASIAVPPPRLILAQSAATAPSAAAASAAPGSPSTQEIELLVARVVSYYEQGDTDGLMSLFASGEPGFWKGFRTRNAYADFFRTTKDRRLRMKRLDWETSPHAARAKGEATVIADYSDGSGKLVRDIPVELDIAVREGQARLTRLNLFPEIK